MLVVTIVRWDYKPTYNVWGPHIVQYKSMETMFLNHFGVLLVWLKLLPYKRGSSLIYLEPWLFQHPKEPIMEQINLTEYTRWCPPPVMLVVPPSYKLVYKPH